MSLKATLIVNMLFFLSTSFAQNTVTEISTNEGNHYITTLISYPINGTYLFEGAAPIVILNPDGTGVFQEHNKAERVMIWGIECDENGQPIFIQEADSAAYSLWYKYNANPQSLVDENWNSVPFSIYFNSSKIYIQGERMKNY